jgi:glycosyltransferase involved in cell wall biosynthesis
MTKLSIIIPTFNSGTTLERCLASIASQTFTDFEILIQDGGSTDNTIELVKTFEKANRGIAVKLQQEKDKGIYDAMNRATLRASGEWLYYLGSDDEFYDPYVIDKIVGSEAAQSGNVMYGNLNFVEPGRSTSEGHTGNGRCNLAKLLAENIGHQAIFYRASFAREIGSYNTDYFTCADWDYNMRCWSKSRFRFVELIIANFSMGGVSNQGIPDLLFRAEVLDNISRYFNPWDPQVWIGRSRIRSERVADKAYSLREKGNRGYLSAMTSSILQWPFGDVVRYKVWLHMLLTRLNIIAKPVHK